MKAVQFMFTLEVQDDASMIRLPIGSTLKETEREVSHKTLEAYHWNKVRCTRQLGLGSTNTLNRKIQEYGLRRETRTEFDTRGGSNENP